jgi:hypothetical protein
MSLTGKEGEDMLSEPIEMKTENLLTYQVMLIRNDASTEVEIHEERNVDFSRIQEHLQQGGSVFITSKPQQKILAPRLQRRRAIKTVTAFYFDHV